MACVGESSRNTAKELAFFGASKAMLEITIGEVKEVIHGEIFTKDTVVGIKAQNLLC